VQHFDFFHFIGIDQVEVTVFVSNNEAVEKVVGKWALQLKLLWNKLRYSTRILFQLEIFSRENNTSIWFDIQGKENTFNENRGHSKKLLTHYHRVEITEIHCHTFLTKISWK